MVQWRELVAEAINTLKAASVADPERSARIMAQEATGAEGAEWLDMLNLHASQRQLAGFDDMLARRLEGEPLQYVVGRWGFRRLDLMIDHRVLIPRPETEVVAGLAVAEATRLAQPIPAGPPVIVVDLGTGSGAIGLSVADEHPTAQVWLADVSADALAVARANVAGLGRSGGRVRVVQGSWFDALPEELVGRVGVVVSNPPYVDPADPVDPEVAWEPQEALFATPALGPVSHVIGSSAPWLVDEGALVVEMAPHQTDPMAQLAELHFRRVEIEPDLAGRARALVARFPRR